MQLEVFTTKNSDFHWIDLVNPSKLELDTVAKKYDLNAIVVRDCLDPIHLPKFEQLSDKQFLILRVFDEKSRSKSSTVLELTRKISIFYSDNYLITIHRSELPLIAETRDSWIKNPENISGNILAKLLSHLLIEMVSTYDAGMSWCQTKLEKYEDLMYNSKNSPASIKQEFLIKRKAYVYKRMLKMSLEILPKIVIISSFNKSLFLDIKERMESKYFESEQIQENANNLINLHLSLSSYNTNKIIRILTIFSVFFSPLTFIVGVYGMNFVYMPELHMVYGYPTVLLVMLGICISLFFWFRKMGWLKVSD